MTGLLSRSGFSRTLVVMALLLLASLLAACGDTGQPKTGSGTPSGNGSRATTLRVAPTTSQGTKDFFNPFFTLNGGSSYGTQGLLYEVLYFTNLYNGQTTGWLASSESYNSDLTQLTFTLRPGVKWNDGKDFTSQDVLFTFNLMKQNPALDTSGVWSILKGVDAPTANTVTFTLQYPNSTALFRIGGNIYIVPQHVWSQISGDPSKFTNDQNPVGTGPYTLKSHTDELITYARNDNYWGTKPAPQTVQVPAIKDNTTAITDMIQGKLDWLGSAWDPKLDPTFTGKDPQHNHTWFSPSNTFMLYLNLTKAPFNNLLVRKAISTAINRNQLPQGVAQYAAVANPSGIIIPSLKDWITPQYQGASFTYDKAQAQAYLKQAGYTLKSDNYFYDAQGKELTMTLNVVNGWSDWDQDTQFIANDLNAAGIKATINTQSDFTPYFSALTGGTYDAALSWTNSGPTPYFAYQGMLDTTNSAPAGKAVNGSATNFERWDDTTSNGYAAKTQAYLKAYEATTDSDKQKAALAGIQQIMVDQLPAIPIAVNVYWNEYTTTNWAGWPDASNPYDSGAPYNSPDFENVILHLQPAS